VLLLKVYLAYKMNDNAGGVRNNVEHWSCLWRVKGLRCHRLDCGLAYETAACSCQVAPHLYLDLNVCGSYSCIYCLYLYQFCSWLYVID
jgi:hypothetical protein